MNKIGGKNDGEEAAITFDIQPNIDSSLLAVTLPASAVTNVLFKSITDPVWIAVIKWLNS